MFGRQTIRAAVATVIVFAACVSGSHFTAAASTGYTLYSSPAHGYSFSYPRDWKMLPRDPKGFDAEVDAPKTSAYFGVYATSVHGKESVKTLYLQLEISVLYMLVPPPTWSHGMRMVNGVTYLEGDATGAIERARQNATNKHWTYQAIVLVAQRGNYEYQFCSLVLLDATPGPAQDREVAQASEFVHIFHSLKLFSPTHA
jgi:hypothetical protein